MTTSRSSLLGPWICRALVLCAALCWNALAPAGVKVRVYPFGEEDPDGDIGEIVLETADVQLPPTQDGDGDPVFDSQGDFVPLVAEGGPTYVEGRTGGDGLAIDFDGADDRLTSGAFDPRNFSTFASLSQAWVKPDSAKSGTRQAVWSLGNDNGGVGITADGRWELIAVSIIPDTASNVEVVFDAWTHVAVFRGGNGAELYVDGALVASGANYWNGVGPVTVGNRTSGGEFFDGTIDDFSITGFSDFEFDPARDIDSSEGEVSGVPGDVDQNSVVDLADYTIWSDNVGFDNGLGGGDGNTLRMGDVDQNGRIDYFDFRIILAAAGQLSAPVPTPSGTLVADDFLYHEPTKALGPGGGFTLQDYGGGQGVWSGRWASTGNAIITGDDFEPKERRFMGLTTTGLSANWLGRSFSLDEVEAGEVLYFAVRFMTLDGQAPSGRFVLNSPDDEAGEISIGIDPSTGFNAKLGLSTEFPFDLIPNVEPNVIHLLVGRLEINAIDDDELLTAWLDPSEEESGDYEVFVQGDVLPDLDALTGQLRLDRGTSGGGDIYWDDVAIGSSWGAVTPAKISRLELQVDTETGDVVLANRSQADIEIHFYHLYSPSGSLSVDGWRGVSDENPLGGWTKNSPSVTLLTESSFSESITIPSQSELSLGQAFSSDGTQDVVARVGTTDGLFNVALRDRDADGVFDVYDNCAADANADQTDVDSDGIGDVCDNCPDLENRGQEDFDGDGIGNYCDTEIADTLRDWSPTGTQGENNMFYGYFDVSDDLTLGGDGEYEAEKFTEFLNDGSGFVTPDAGTWRSALNHWNGASWDLTSAAAEPWTSMGPLDVHPNDPDPEAEHWVIRRWVSDRDGRVSVLWHAHHENVACGGNGVTGILYHNDEPLDQASIDAPDNVGVTRAVEISIRAGDTVDLALNAIGSDGSNDDGCDGSQTWFLVSELEGLAFRRGDADDSSEINITDAVFLLNYLFLGGETPPCLDAADGTDDGDLNITDAVYVLNFLFLGGPAPPEPFEDCGLDPTDDELDCAGFKGCP